jgi:pimeloyl-ACP methyl ester carboxylesterase
MFEGFEHGIASIGGADISYIRGGAGPPLLLLHGFPQNKAKRSCTARWTWRTWKTCGAIGLFCATGVLTLIRA